MDTVEYRERHELFRTHARAVLAGDGVETTRVKQLIGPDHLLPHHAFMFALFVTCVGQHFGEDLDWARLDVLTERLRRTAPEVSQLKTEALIRVCYDEPHLLMEVPQSEHPALIWAVCRIIVGPECAASDVEDLFDRADEAGRDIAQSVFAAAGRYAWRAGTEAS